VSHLARTIINVELVAQIKLVPDDETAEILSQTAARLNEAANYCSAQAWDSGVFGRVGLQRLCYREIRGTFGLSAQAAIHVTRKVADSYRKDRRSLRQLRPDGAVTYDDRILSWKPDMTTVSIWTLGGRITVRFVAGERSKKLLSTRKGESDLVVRDGMFFLYATCVVEETEPIWSGEVLGVDRGIVNIATCSNGANYTGKAVNAVRNRNCALRARLQAKKTKSAKRLLKKRKSKESRFATDTNHKISYRIVREAQRTGSAISLEDLEGIRNRTRVSKPQRRTHHSWSYYQLGEFISYKAALSGVPVVFVDPRNTSRRCPMCHCASKENRPSRDEFICQVCGLAGPADLIASVNIAFLGKCELGRADVTQPDAGIQVGPETRVHGSCPNRASQMSPSDPPTVLLASSAL